MSCSEILKLHKSIRVKTLHSYLLTTEGLADGRTDGRTDKHGVYRAITFNRSCNVLKVNPSGKTAYGAKRMPKQKTISNSNSISILGIPVTYSRHNGKCNICAFHEENHAFEDWIFVRLSSLVLAYEWTTNGKNVCSLIDRFRSIYDARK